MYRCKDCGATYKYMLNYCPKCGGTIVELDASQVQLELRKQAPVLVVTTNEIPGYLVKKVLGDIFGLTVRARNYFSNLGAQFRTVVGGEVGGYTRLLVDSRNEARIRLIEEARKCGANAVLAMRFDCNEIGGIMTEIAAYGTAVVVEPIAS